MRYFKLVAGLVLMILIIFSAFGCKKKTKKHVEQKPEEQVVVYDTTSAKGIILADVKTRTDSAISFALYLPSAYAISRNWPVIFIFDAQARGKLPVELYKELAEKYGYILIGSNNSKNRVEWDVNKLEINKLISDAFGRFAIDKQRVYTMGFSGGARIACLVALDLAKIQGVIGCAAGFPELNKPLDKSFCYIGFSGDEDFNRVEMVKLDENLASTGLPFYIRYYKGKHDWAPASIMNEGFLWLEFNSYKSNLSAKNETYLADFKKQIDDEINKAEKTKNNWEQYNTLKKAFTFLNNVTDISDYNNKLAALERSDKIKKIKADQQNMFSKEISKQEEYRTEINKGNLEWWKKEIGIIYKTAASKNNSPETFMAKRLKNYISLIANSAATNALAGNQTEASAFFLSVYSMADPYNPDFFYLSAYFFARENKVDQSLMFLRNAVKAGYKDKKKLQTDQTFDVLRQNKAFNDIVNSIKE
jgi:dienelactone hydrolase